MMRRQVSFRRLVLAAPEISPGYGFAGPSPSSVALTNLGGCSRSPASEEFVCD